MKQSSTTTGTSRDCFSLEIKLGVLCWGAGVHAQRGDAGKRPSPNNIKRTHSTRRMEQSGT